MKNKKSKKINISKKQDFNDVINKCINKNGAIDLLKMEKLEGSCGYNGGRGCDVTSGPCSCGAWH